MKKTAYLLLAVMLVTVIAILWTRVFTRGSGSQERLSDLPSHMGEDKSEPQKDYDLSLRTASRHVTSADSAEALNVEFLEDASGTMEDKGKDVAGEVEHTRYKQGFTATDVLVFENKGNKGKESHAVIQDAQAIAIAHKVIGDIEYDEKGEIRVDRLEGKIRVVFPVNKETPQGTRYRGPDYAAEETLWGQDAMGSRLDQDAMGSRLDNREMI